MNATPSSSKTNPKILNIAAYKFTPLTNLSERRELLRDFCREIGLRGTILLSPEGINLFIAGDRTSVNSLLDILLSDPEIGDLEVKESFNSYQPFNRMLVRLKKEIIAFGVEGVDPITETSPKLEPQELKRWLDEGRACTLLDVRNDYEIRLGTFENALPIGVDHFRQFPEAVENLSQESKKQPLVMFCTGGIRCEKAGPFMEQAGFHNVYQLNGGILKYFEDCGADHYHGDCFVFDKRTALNPNLEETEATLCYACQTPLTPEEQRSLHYAPSISCPYCYDLVKADQ